MSRLDELLDQWAADGPMAPLTPQCLDFNTVIQIIDHPETVSSDDWRHLETCRYCLRSVVRIRRDRELIEAPLRPDEDFSVEVPTRNSNSGPMAKLALRLSRSIAAYPWVTGIAAILVLALGISFLVNRRGPRGSFHDVPNLLATVDGSYLARGVDRSATDPEGANRIYEIRVKLTTPASVAALYLDHTRNLKTVLPQPQSEEDAREIEWRFMVRITRDDPPGLQWFGIIAPAEAQSVEAVRADLQITLDNELTTLSLPEVMKRLEAQLEARPGISFRSHKFAVSERPLP